MKRILGALFILTLAQCLWANPGDVTLCVTSVSDTRVIIKEAPANITYTIILDPTSSVNGYPGAHMIIYVFYADAKQGKIGRVSDSDESTILALGRTYLRYMRTHKRCATFR